MTCENAFLTRPQAALVAGQ